MSAIDDSSFIVTDFTQRKYLLYTIDSLITSSKPFIEDQLDQKGVVYGAYYNPDLNKLFYQGYLAGNHRLYEKDVKSDEVIGYATLLDAPMEPNTIEVKNHLSHAESSSNADNTLFAFAYRFAPMLETYNYKTNTLKTIVIPNKKVPIYTTSQGDNGVVRVGVRENTTNKFSDIFISEKYIYALYRGKGVFEEKAKKSIMYVFDLELNPLKKISLDVELSNFEVKNDAILYGLDITTDIYPRIVKYEL